jgi:hypothetical protein
MLPTLLGLSGVVLTVSLGMAISAFVSQNLAFGAAQGAAALYVAEAGLNDALWKLARDKNHQNVTGYSLPVGEGAATIRVESTTGTPVACTVPVPLNQVCVVASGTVGSRTRKIQSLVNVTATVGALSQASWVEID